MPTTFWFLRVLALIALLVYAAMAALVWSVTPRPVEYNEPVVVNLPPRAAAAAEATPGAGISDAGTAAAPTESVP